MGKKGTPEHLEQVALFEWADRMTPLVPELANMFAIPNGAKLPFFKDASGKRVCVQAQFLKAEGLKPGVPDVFLSVPNDRYHGFYLEMKAGKNKLSVDQCDWIERLSLAGYFCGVYWSWTDAANEILAYLGKRMRV